MKVMKRVFMVLKRTGAIHCLSSFIVVCFIASFLLRHFEPGIKTLGDAFWYCFVASTTIGFGDIYATSTIGRIITVFVSINGIFVFAMMTGVVVSYYMEFLHYKREKSISMFLEKLENLPNLSKEELTELSDKIKKIK